MALPRTAPPTSSTARDVVCVNSSMFARVPGPADFDATDATISAYGTGTTDDTACTIGTVACAPQLIRLRFGAPMCSRKFTGGQTNGPTAAGVRSIAVMPAAAYRGALALCALADVASNTTDGSGSCCSSQSTPPADAAIPNERARSMPSDSTTPTM